MKENKTLFNSPGIRWTAAILLVVAAFAAGALWRGGRDDGHRHDAVDARQPDAPAAKAEVWTCSMHPQIKLPKAGQCPICFMDLIPLDTGDDDEGGLRELSVSENAAMLMEIETVPVERRFVTADVRMVGKVDYDETRVSYITAWVPGRLDRLFVDYTGVPVKKGDHMVSLYSPELLGAQEELLQVIRATKALEGSGVSIDRGTTETTVNATREKLRLWGLTPEQIANIERRGKAEDHVTIYAPAGGIVVHKNAQEGMYVGTGTRIYTIVDLSRVWVNLDAYESDLEWVKYGQKVTFTAESYPGEEFTGSISFIQPVLNEATRTVKVRVNVPNGDGRLKPGMFVRAVADAQIATGGRIMNSALAGKWISPMHPEIVKDGPGACDVCGMPLVRAESLGYVSSEPSAEDRPLVIPATAPLLTGKRAIVYVEVSGKDKPTFEGREIVLGPRAGDYYLVRHGLEEGERVVTKGNFKLDAELQIRAKPSMMTPGGGGGGGEHAHHGGGKPKADDEPMARTGPTVSAVVESQLHDVIAAAHAATELSAGKDLDRIRAAYRALQESVAAVSAASLSEHDGMLWKEHSMLLGNDGAEGASIRTSAEAVRLADTTRGHIASMQARFGLTHGGHAMPTVPAVDPVFHEQLAAVVDGYLGVQTALATDDQGTATGSAKKTLEALAKVDMELVTGKDHTDWMKHANDLKALLVALSDADGIEPIRAQFALLSEQFATTLARFGVPEGTLYEASCPMAFDNRGASWIQNGEEINNPYFGETMLRCGEIRKVLK